MQAWTEASGAVLLALSGSSPLKYLCMEPTLLPSPHFIFSTKWAVITKSKVCICLELIDWMDKKHTNSLEAPLCFVLNRLCVLCIQSSGMNAITRILPSDRRELWCYCTGISTSFHHISMADGTTFRDTNRHVAHIKVDVNWPVLKEQFLDCMYRSSDISEDLKFHRYRVSCLDMKQGRSRTRTIPS